MIPSFNAKRHERFSGPYIKRCIHTKQMESFLCDVFEVTDLNSTEIRPPLDESGIISPEGVLAYTTLFAHPRIKTVLRFSNFYKAVFGVRPVIKLLFASSTGPIPETYEASLEYIEKHTFYKYAAPDFKVIKEKEMFKDSFSLSLSSPSPSPSQIKLELFQSLKERLYSSSSSSSSPPNVDQDTIKYDEQKTLYTNWLAIQNVVQNATLNVALSAINPLTGLKLLRLPIANIVENVSQREFVAYLFSQDYHFQRLLYNSKLLVISSTENEESIELDGLAAFGPSVVFVSSSSSSISRVEEIKENALKICANVFTYSVDQEWVFEVVPKVAMLCFFTRTHPLVLSRVPANSARLLVKPELKRRGPKGLQSHHLGLQVSTLLGQPTSIPLPIIDYMFELYGRVKDKVDKAYQGTEGQEAKANCVLVIDNRENPLTVMSTYISLANMDPKQWDVVVVTGEDESSRRYYDTELPMSSNKNKNNGIHITHPLVSKKVKFNLDTYNEVMKDELLWLQIAGHSYTYALTVQDDGMILKPGLEEKFLNRGFHYVGSPWSKSPLLAEAGVPDSMVGNGGLSLRNVNTMVQICSSAESKSRKRDLFLNNLQLMPEDVFFSSEVAKLGLGNTNYNQPTFAEATRFAMEQIWCPDALGIHKPWGYVPWQQLQTYLNGTLSTSF